MSNPALRALVLAMAAALAAAASAADDVDLQVRGNETVDGTIRPADERESFPLDAPRGAKLVATVKKTSVGAPVPTLELLDESLATIVGGTATSTGAKLTVKSLGAGGLVRLRVAGDGAADGDYRLRLTMTPQKRWTAKSTVDLAPGAETTIAFAAPAGATATATLTPGRGSPLAPLLLDLTGPNGFVHAADPATATARRHEIRGVRLVRTGEFVVRFMNDGATAGSWSLTIRLTTPRLARVGVDIGDDAALGSFGGGAQVFGRVVDPSGAPIDPPESGGALDGASISVPAGALGAPAVVALTASDTFFVDDANHASGIALKLTPAGTTFATPVTVTLPYDPQSFEDPASELTIYIRNDSTGELEAVPRDQLVFDLNAASVSFPTSHFSGFQSTSPRDRPFKGAFVELEIVGGPRTAFGGSFSVGLNGIAGLKGPRNGNRFNRTYGRRGFTFGSGVLSLIGPPANDTGFVDVADDLHVTLGVPMAGARKYVRGRNDGVFLSEQAPGAPGASMSALFRVAKGAPTAANVAGDWHAFVFEASAREDGPVPDQVRLVGRRARLRFALDRSVTATFVVTRAATAAADGTWAESMDKKRPPPGTFSIDKTNGFVRVEMALGSSELSNTVDLVPVLRGDVLVGATSGAKNDDGGTLVGAVVRTVILVRASTGARAAALLGRSLFSGFATSTVDRPGAAGDLAWLDEQFDAVHGPGPALTVSGKRVAFDHDAAGAPRATPSDVAVADNFQTLADGSYRELASDVIGAFSPRGGFYIATRFTPPTFGIGFGVVGKPKQ